METLLLVAAVFFLLGLIRRNFQRNVELEYRYKFFALRDKLRSLAIEGKIKKEKWEFNYLDSSLSKTVCKLDTINLFETIYVHIKHRNDPSVKKFRLHLHKSLDKNESFNEVYSEYGKLLVQYISKRHFVITFSIGIGLFSILMSIKYFQVFTNRLRQLIKELRDTPEHSTAHLFCN